MKKLKLKLSLLLLLFFVLLLGSCNIIYTIDLYLSDVMNVADKGENMLITATFAFAAPGEEDKPKLIEFIKENFRNPQNFREETIDYSDYIFCDIDVPLQPKNEGDHTPDLVFLTADKNKQTDSYRFTLYFNQTSWDKMSKYIEEQFYQKMELENISFNFTVNNDFADEVEFNTGAVYINDKPVPYMTVVPIQRRKKITLKFSDVLRDSLAYNPVVVGEFKEKSTGK